MTTKQIAEYTGKPEQTIRNWVRDLASKSDVIKSKLDASSSRYPADYTLAETCQIIAEGMGEDVAAVYRTNAVNAELGTNFKPRYSAAFLREYRITYGIEAAKGLLAELGFAPKAPTNIIPLPALPAPVNSDEEYRAVRELLGDSGMRQVLAVAHRAAEKHRAVVTSDSLQTRLPIEGWKA